MIEHEDRHVDVVKHREPLSERFLRSVPAVPALARELDILARFRTDLAAAGVVGEDRLGRLLFLSMTSRLLRKPVSVVVRGAASTGKSYTVQKVLGFFPESASYELTAMSERSLAYSDEPIAHR